MATFGERKRALYECLRLAEEAQVKPSTPAAPMEVDGNVRMNNRQMKSRMKQFRGRKSLYLRKETAPPRNQSTFALSRRNSDRWTYYSMEDVPDVTDNTNALAVAACMQEIQANKLHSKPPTDDSDSKVEFKLPLRICDYQRDKKEKTLFVNSKIILPEYVVGEKTKHKSNKVTGCVAIKKNKNSSNDATNLHLDHLYDDEDDE